MNSNIDSIKVVGCDLEVPLLNGSSKRYVNLDNAASTPVLQTVQEGVNRFMQWYSSIHRGAGFKSQVATWAYEEARKMLIRFLGGEPAERVAIFGKNTTDAVNKLANRFPFKENDILLSSLMEHHSNDLPWRRQAKVELIELDELGRIDINDLEQKLKKHAGRVPLVAVTGASNVSGIINPIYEMAELAHRHGAEIFVDAAQMAPHRKIEMGKKGNTAAIDYLALSAHKMYAPYGAGALIGWPDVFKKGEPDYTGGGTVKFVRSDDVLWRDPPDKEEAGSPNVVGVVALGLAAQVLNKVGMDWVAEHEGILTKRILKGLENLDKVEIFGTKSTDKNARLGVVPFNIKGMPHPKTAAILGCEYGIGVRHGCFCAHPYVQRLLNCPDTESDKFYNKILHGERVDLPGMVRLSFGIYNTEEDVDYTLNAIAEICAERYRGNYVVNTLHGDYWPEGFAPQFNDYFRFI